MSAITASASPVEAGHYRVTLSTEQFLHTVRLHAEGYLPDDNYFHLAP